MGRGGAFSFLPSLVDWEMKRHARNSLTLSPSFVSGHLASQGSTRMRVFGTRTDTVHHFRFTQSQLTLIPTRIQCPGVIRWRSKLAGYVSVLPSTIIESL